MCVFVHAIYNRDGLLEKRPLRRYLGPFVLWSTWMNLKCSHLHNGTRTTCPDLEAQSGVADGEEEGREKRKEASHREGGRAHSQNDTSRNRGWLGPTGRDVSPRHAAASMTNVSGTVRCPRAWLLGGSGRAAFHTWIPVGHKGGPPGGGGCPEAVSVEDLSPLQSLRVFMSLCLGEGCALPGGRGTGAIEPTLASSLATGRPQPSFWSHGVNNIYFVGCSEDEKL